MAPWSSQHATTVPTFRSAALAYERVDGRKSSIWVANADASHPRRIARVGYAPSLSPDGHWLTYALPSRRGGLGAVQLVNLVSGKSRPIGHVGVVWSPESRRLALLDETGLSVLEITSRRRRIVLKLRNLALGSFDSGGTALTYAQDNGKAGRARRSDVYTVRLSDRKVNRLTRNGHSDDPTWGGGWIAYRRFRFSNEWAIGSVRVMRSDGSGDRLIARGHDDVSQAEQGIEPVQLSARGKHLVVCLAFEFGCPPAAFTIPAGRRVRLSFRRNPHTLPAPDGISRDGAEILVSEDPFESNLGYHVYVVPFGAGKTRLLLRGARSPSWTR